MNAATLPQLTLEQLIEQAKNQPVDFSTTMQVIDQYYSFTPTPFKNGGISNAANSNNGSCKLFAFAQRHHLDSQTTLNLFGDFYRIDVLQNPTGEDHQNIRNFIQFGWQGIEFANQALTPLN